MKTSLVLSGVAAVSDDSTYYYVVLAVNAAGESPNCNQASLTNRGKIESWSLTSLQNRLVKTGGRLVRHARYYWLLLAEGHLSRRLFGSMLRMIAALVLPDG